MGDSVAPAADPDPIEPGLEPEAASAPLPPSRGPQRPLGPDGGTSHVGSNLVSVKALSCMGRLCFVCVTICSLVAGQHSWFRLATEKLL